MNTNINTESPTSHKKLPTDVATRLVSDMIAVAAHKGMGIQSLYPHQLWNLYCAVLDQRALPDGELVKRRKCRIIPQSPETIAFFYADLDMEDDDMERCLDLLQQNGGSPPCSAGISV